jgi:hypothetical protein
VAQQDAQVWDFGADAANVSTRTKEMKGGSTYTRLTIFLLLACVPAWASDVDRLSDFAARFCWKHTNYLPSDNVRFAPVSVLPAEEQRPGFGKYKLEATGYPDSQFQLRDSRPLTFVSSLNPPAGEELPTHLWHLISVPRPGKEWDGLLTNYEEALEGNAISQADYEFLARTSLLDLFESGAERHYLIYNWAPPADRQWVRDRWEAIFGSAAVQQLVHPNEAYDHQFYYVTMPERAEQITPGSWLYPSQRKVWAPGTAYGFVFDDHGQCVGRATIEITP